MTTANYDFCALMDAHLQAITPEHEAAFRGPVVPHYLDGAIVWMHDHYNTAIVQGPGAEPDTWAITTTDADGSTSTYEYESRDLRPAGRITQFRWPAEVTPDPLCGFSPDEIVVGPGGQTLAQAAAAERK